MTSTMRDFDKERRERPAYTFLLGGHEFRVRSEVRPEAVRGYEDLTEESSLEETMRAVDDLVIAAIHPDDESEWTRIRADESDPVGLDTITAIVVWLIEAVVARPTEAPLPSSAGQRSRRTGTRSTDESRSLEAAG